MGTLTSSECNINSLRCWCTRYRDVWFPSGCPHTPDNVSWLLYSRFSPWYRLNVRVWRYQVVSWCSKKTSEVKYCRVRYSTKLNGECPSRHNILNSNEFSRRVGSVTCDERPRPHVCPASWMKSLEETRRWMMTPSALWVPYKQVDPSINKIVEFLPWNTQGTFHWRKHPVVSRHESRFINACCFFSFLFFPLVS